MEKRGSIIGGIILIMLGAFFLLLQFFPQLGEIFNLSQQWPLIIIGAGLIFLIVGLIGNPPLLIPGMIISGTGLILYYQNSTGDWGSWAYIWSLYPIFVGVGLMLMHARQGDWRQGMRDGGGLVFIGIVLYVIFGGFFNGFGGIGRLWPIFIILGGLWLLWKNRPFSQPPSEKGKRPEL